MEDRPVKDGLTLKCPVCAARFRAERQCPRCGADLTPLMKLAGAAWRLRQEARAALAGGDTPRGRALAAAAQRLHATAQGRRLELLAAWLAGD